MITPAILALLVTLGFGTVAWARLGETEDALVQRYGRPVLKRHFAWCDKENFSVNGFSIEVTLLNGVSAGESYRISSGTLTVSQVEDLLSANCQGFAWYEVPKSEITQDVFRSIRQKWQRPNGSTAIFTGSSIEFKSINLIIAEKDANKPPPTPSTAGF